MTISEQKIVDFDIYCPKCIHYKKSEGEDPCSICLTNPTNQNSRKPIKYEGTVPNKNLRKLRNN